MQQFPNLKKPGPLLVSAVTGALSVTPKSVLENADGWLALLHLPKASTLLTATVLLKVAPLALVGAVVWWLWPSQELRRGVAALFGHGAEGKVTFVPNRQQCIIYYVEQTGQTQISIHGFITNTTKGPLRFLVSELKARGTVTQVLGLFSPRRANAYRSEVAINPAATALFTATGFFPGKLPDNQKVTLMLTDQHAKVHRFKFGGLTRTNP